MDTLSKPIAIMTEVAAPQRTSELESRQVAEAAREELWEQASFMRDLFQGRFRLDLIHPPPQPDPEEPEEKERASIFLQKLREFARDRIDGDAIDREEWVPEEVLDGLRELGLSRDSEMLVHRFPCDEQASWSTHALPSTA